jgi:arginase
VILTVRSDVGAGVRGSDQGIDALLNLSRQSSLFERIETRESVVTFPEGFTSEYAKHIEQILHISETVCDDVCDSLLSGHFPIVLSGDHSSAAGTIAGIKKANPESRLGIIWVDAHADLHTPFTSFSGNMHGMPVAAALGVDNLACLLRDPDKMTQEFWSRLKLVGGVFDTDCLDGSISKGTGLPVENGLMPNEAEDLLSVILQDDSRVLESVKVSRGSI